MSSLICWPTYYKDESERHITIIADSLFSSPGIGQSYSKLLELGPKVFTIPVRAFGLGKNPPVFQESLGLGFVGNVILGQSTALLATQAFHNLHHTGIASIPPSLRDFALCIGKIAVELLTSYRNPKDLSDTQFVLVGNCLREKKPAACTISFTKGKPEVLTYYLAKDDEILIFGADWEAIHKDIMLFRENAANEFEWVWAPKAVLHQHIVEKRNKTIGGIIHGGIVRPVKGFILREVTFQVPKKPTFSTVGLPPFSPTTIGNWQFFPHSMEYGSWQDN